MILVLVFGPALVALAALAEALRLLFPSAKQTQSGWRLFWSYLLLTITFGIGSCYGTMFADGFARRGVVGIPWAAAAAAVALVGLAIFYVREVRRLPRLAGRERAGLAVLAIVLCAVCASAMLFLVWQ